MEQCVVYTIDSYVSEMALDLFRVNEQPPYEYVGKVCALNNDEPKTCEKYIS
jgi:hypothetical protein